MCQFKSVFTKISTSSLIYCCRVEKIVSELIRGIKKNFKFQSVLVKFSLTKRSADINSKKNCVSESIESIIQAVKYQALSKNRQFKSIFV